MPKILLSYRRADAIEIAARIFTYLDSCDHFSVFSPDSDTHPAATFSEKIYKQVQDSDLVCVVIGPNWIGKRLDGVPSIQNESDPVRILLREAFAADKIVLPILANGGCMPQVADLPKDVEDLVFRNAIEITDRRFDHDMEMITRVINRSSGFRTKSQLHLPFTHRQNLVLFMHGLGGDAQSTWGKFPAFLLQNPRISAKCDVAYYRFPTSLFRIPFSRRAPKIQELAAGLRSQIDNRYADYNAIALVCHSLGGLIARRYIIEEIKDSRPLRVSHLALFGVPNNGSALASTGRFISWRHGQLKQLCRDADVIELMNEDWIRYNIQSKVATKFIIGTQDRVVDRFSVAGYWGNPDIETVIGKGHVDLVKPVAQDDDAVIFLTRFILPMVDGTVETAKSPKPVSTPTKGIGNRS